MLAHMLAHILAHIDSAAWPVARLLNGSTRTIPPHVSMLCLRTATRRTDRYSPFVPAGAVGGVSLMAFPFVLVWVGLASANASTLST
jgi:hypothetical protein